MLGATEVPTKLCLDDYLKVMKRKEIKKIIADFI